MEKSALTDKLNQEDATIVKCINRTADAEDFGYYTRQGKALFTSQQIMDVLNLLKEDELPNGDFSDNEVSLYFDLKYTVGVKF